MKFGKSLRNEIAVTLPQFRGEFIAYKVLKQQVKLIADEESQRFQNLGSSENCLRNVGNSGEEINGFMELLDNELEKVNKFYFDKEEEYIIRMKELKVRVANLETSEDWIQVKLDILEFHAEMVLLLHYSVINFAGLLKIVKKHNKKTGTVICLAFMPKVLQQPFFTTGLVCDLLRECEMILSTFSM